MTCNFEFDGVKAPTIEGLLHAIMANSIEGYDSPVDIASLSRDEQMAMNYKLPFNFFQETLDYHNAEGTRVAQIVNRTWSKNLQTNKYIFNPISSDGQAVTKLLNNGQNDDHFASEGNYGYSNTQLGHIDQYCNFCRDLGILIHKCLEIAINNNESSGPYIQKQDYLDSLDEVWNFINRYKTPALEWTEATARLMPTKNFILKADRQAVIEKIQQITHTMIETIKSRCGNDVKIMAEVPIKYKHPTDSTKGVYSGIIDVLAYDTQGNVWIFDYKTSSHVNFGPKALNAYAFQISAYKEMLVDLGIAPDNINMELLPLEYKVDNTGEIAINYTDPSLTRRTAKNLKLPLTIWEQAHLKKNLKRFFPVTKKSLTVEELSTRNAKLQSQIGALITPTQKRKASVELQKEFLTSSIKNGNATIIWSEDGSYGRAGVIINKWVQEGDVYIGYTETGVEKIRGTIDEIAQKEADALSDELKARTSAISEALSMGDYESIRDLFYRDEKKAQAMLFALEPYLSSDWEEIHIPELKDRNIITMYNNVTKEYSFIIVSDLAALDQSRIREGSEESKLIPPDANILHPVIKTKSDFVKYKAFNELPGLKVEDHLTLEALLTISQFKDLLPSTDGKINLSRVQVVSSISGQSSMGTNLDKYIQTLRLLEYVSVNSPESLTDGTAELFKDGYSQFDNTFVISDPLQTLCNMVINRVGAYKLNCPDIGLDMFSSSAVEMDLMHVEQAMQEVKQFYKESEYKRNFEDPIGRIYYGLEQLAASLKRGNVNDQIYRQTKHGLTGAELFGAGLDMLKYGESRTFSHNGLLVAGMAQGLDNSVSYASSDSSIRFLQRLISSASQQINVETIKIADEVNAATKKYLAGVSGFTKFVVGNTADQYIQLYEHTSDGKMSGQMILKNPYGSNDLAPHQSEYLEVILWSFNRLRMVGLSDSVKKMTYAELKEDTESFTKYKEMVNLNDKYRYVPLVRHDGAQNLITTFKILVNPNESLDQSNQKTRKFFGRLAERWNQHIQPLLLTPEQRQYESKDFDPENGEFTYHSPYNLQGQHRVETLQNNDIRDWEVNLNFLAIEHAAAQFKEVYYNQVLKMASNILAEIEIAEVMTGQKLDKTKEALVDRIIVSIFHRDLIDDEYKTTAKVIGALKQLTSYLTIAVRPGLFIKEMILGQIKNAATIWAENIVNDVPITFAHIMKAAGIVYTNGLFTENASTFEGETFGDFRLVNTLNNYYRINDRDLNVIGDSLAYDHHGFMNVGSRFLYLNTTAPDWFHRMTLLVAKMIADGSWEAHTVENGELVYDAAKDERYKEFVLYLRAHDGDLSGEPTTESYVKAKALYQLKIQQLKNDGHTTLKGGENGEFSYNIPLAYSTQEMDSFKEQVGMIFGYYSHEERTNTQKGLSWLLHTQFMTFMPGEIRKYLASGKHESSAGKVVHMIDPVTHEKLYYVTNEAGLDVMLRESEVNPQDRTKPVVQFTYVPLEGLLVSTLKTLNEIFTGKWDSELNRDRHNRAKLFLFNFLLGLLLKGLWGFLIALGIDAKNASKEYRVIADIMKLGPKIGQELDFFDTVASSLTSIGIVGLDIIPSMTSKVIGLSGALGNVLKEGALS